MSLIWSLSTPGKHLKAFSAQCVITLHFAAKIDVSTLLSTVWSDGLREALPAPTVAFGKSGEEKTIELSFHFTV